jgi:hypothetical protein
MFERVSLVGHLTQHIRNKMGVDDMCARAFIIKNVDVNTEVAATLKAAYGPNIFKTAMGGSLTGIIELEEAKGMAMVCKDIGYLAMELRAPCR